MVMIIEKALYGLKSSSAGMRAMFLKFTEGSLRFEPTRVENNAYIHGNVKENAS